jgi:DNA-binding transcriptional regulator YiaG
MLTDEQTSPEQIAALRAMTGLRRLQLAERLYWSARKMKAAGLRSQHPDWPETRLNEAVRQIFSHART